MSVIETILVIGIVGGAAVLLILSFIKKTKGTGGGCGGGCGDGCSTEKTCQSDEDSKTADK